MQLTFDLFANFSVKIWDVQENSPTLEMFLPTFILTNIYIARFQCCQSPPPFSRKGRQFSYKSAPQISLLSYWQLQCSSFQKQVYKQLQ